MAMPGQDSQLHRSADGHPEAVPEISAAPSPAKGRGFSQIAQIALVAILALSVLGLGIETPFVKDAEPQSAQWIADIVDHGNWLLPHDYYHMVLRKPPLFYWLAALAAKASSGRVDEVNSRVVSLLAGALLAAEVWAWSTARLGPGGGWLAFGFLLGIYGFASRATTALTDMLMSLLLFSVYFLVMPQLQTQLIPCDGLARTATGPDRRRLGEAELDTADEPEGGKPGTLGPLPNDQRRGCSDNSGISMLSWRTLGAGVLLGLALLTKGPVVIALLVLAIALYFLILKPGGSPRSRAHQAERSAAERTRRSASGAEQRSLRGAHKMTSLPPGEVRWNRAKESAACVIRFGAHKKDSAMSALIKSNAFRLLTQGWPWIILLISVAIASVWYGPALIGGRNRLAEVLFAENFGHFVPASAGGTGEAARPVYYIALRMLGASLPLSLLLPALILALGSGGLIRESRDLLYQLAMLFAVLLLFSAASAKRDDYVLPALPPLAILFAALFAGTNKTATPDVAAAGKVRWANYVRDATVVATAIGMSLTVITAALLVRHGAGIALAGNHLASNDESFAGIFADGITRLTPPFAIFVALLALGVVLSLAGVLRGHAMASGMGLAIMCLATSTLWTATVRPREAATRSVAHFAAEVAGKASGAKLYVAHDDPEFAWYYHHAVPALPRRIAISGPPAGVSVYFVGRPADLAAIAPSVRTRMQKVLDSNLLGGGGSPALYQFGLK